MTLVTFEVRPELLFFNMYVKKPSGIPGLEVEVPDDKDDEAYTALLGDTEATKFNFQNYAGRLFCDFIIPDHFLNTTQVLKVFANKCVPPIYTNKKVTIIALNQQGPDQGPGC